jgi:predicted GIY-YIG superfamily endonuclease
MGASAGMPNFDREGCPSKPEGRRRAAPSRLRRFGWRAGLDREDRQRLMKYVYLLESVDHPEETYVGATDDLKSRFVAHNAGRSPHTAKFKPWRLVTYIAFSDEQKAIDFERYLKSASVRAFANKRLR